MIEEFIPVGKENAVTRQMLSVMTGLSDRVVRKEIMQARAAGIPIVSSSHSAGYYIAETEAEKQIILRELSSRIANMAKTYKAIRNTVQPEGQLSIEDELSALAVNLVASSVEYLEECRE